MDLEIRRTSSKKILLHVTCEEIGKAFKFYYTFYTFSLVIVPNSKKNYVLKHIL